jgi:hypothetical protein
VADSHWLVPIRYWLLICALGLRSDGQRVVEEIGLTGDEKSRRGCTVVLENFGGVDEVGMAPAWLCAWSATSRASRSGVE